MRFYFYLLVNIFFYLLFSLYWTTALKKKKNPNTQPIPAESVRHTKPKVIRSEFRRITNSIFTLSHGSWFFLPDQRVRAIYRRGILCQAAWAGWTWTATCLLWNQILMFTQTGSGAKSEALLMMWKTINKCRLRLLLWHFNWRHQLFTQVKRGQGMCACVWGLYEFDCSQ